SGFGFQHDFNLQRVQGDGRCANHDTGARSPRFLSFVLEKQIQPRLFKQWFFDCPDGIMEKPLNNENGFSLLELLVGSMILGTTVLAFMAISHHLQSNSIRTESKFQTESGVSLFV